jgi:hypothetical protein
VKPRLCKLCHQRPAAVPDRDRPRRYNEICADCHARRLANDLAIVLAYNQQRKAKERIR